MSRLGIINVISNNFSYKVASVVIAILVWAIVQGEEVVELNKRLVIRVVVPQNRMMREEGTFYLDAKIKGPRILMGNLYEKSEIETALYLSDHELGELRYRISRDFFPGWDDRLELDVIEPAIIKFFIDEKDSVRLPVREVFQGAPAAGFQIEKSQILPKDVTVTGLKSELKKIKELTTEPIEISDIQSNRAFQVAVQARGLSKAEFSDQTVEVVLQVGEAKENVRFTNIPVAVLGSDLTATISPKFATIEIQGTPSVLRFIQKSDFAAFIDAKELPPGKHERSIQVKIPSDTVLIDTVPARASVVLTNTPGQQG